MSDKLHALFVNFPQFWLLSVAYFICSLGSVKSSDVRVEGVAFLTPHLKSQTSFDPLPLIDSFSIVP